ncbi:hypothetical protein GFJ90_20655 [Salmonella enterica subsp. enterica serovar Enteritidis]|nr:hypothetical protein [Salmonella enterica subsp. enterica serovar Enteritidis]
MNVACDGPSGRGPWMDRVIRSQLDACTKKTRTPPLPPGPPPGRQLRRRTPPGPGGGAAVIGQ